MKGQLKKNLVRPFLPLGFSSLLLIVLLCGLSQSSQAIEAEPRVTSASTARERNHPGLLDYQRGVSICEQTKNRVSNPGFEDGIGWPNHWYEGGNGCTYGTCEPGHDSATSAMILSGSVITDRCMLFTSTDEIPVEPGEFYDYSAWMKATLLEGEAYLRIEFWSHQGYPPVWKWEGEGRTNSVTNTRGEWVQVTGSVQVPTDAEYARIEPTLPCPSKGVVWFDDIFFGLATCLDISKSGDPDPVEPGQMLTYTIVYSNTGRERATNVEIIETYDKYVRFESAQPPPLTGTTNIWDIPELLPGISGTLTVRVQVADDTGERALLINGVLIRSDETVEPIYIVITTTITPTNGCDITLYSPYTEKTVEPGHRTDYDLNLYNAGSYDGQSDLVATFSQGWDVIITPPPPYTVPWGSLEEVTVTVRVPDDAFSGTVDVTTVTATLVCEPPCNKTVTATGTLTTTVGLGGDVVLAQDHAGSAPPGGQVVYTHILTNVANVTQTVTLTACSSQGYTVTVEPTTTESLAPWDGSAVVMVTVRMPGDALIGNVYTTVVTATGAMAGQDTITDTTTVEYKVYLPLILRSWPPIPVLYSIDNADGNGSYDVCWSAIGWATGYILEEATNSACTDVAEIYTCTNPYHHISGRGAARYYYCVKACNSVCGALSNVEEVDVLWEHEDNDWVDHRANGPLVSGLDYYGHHGDLWDCFKIDVQTARQITADLTNYTGDGVQLLLYYQSSENLKERDFEPPYHVEHTGSRGEYYICIFTESGHNTAKPYTLRATFP